MASREVQMLGIEMRIPFSTLRYGAGGPQDWGVNFERKLRRRIETARNGEKIRPNIDALLR